MPDPTVKDHAQWRDFMCRNASNYNTDLDVGAGSYHYALFSAIAESLALQSQTAVLLSRKQALETMSEAEVEAEYGTTVPRQQETASTGFVTMEAAATGTTLLAGDRMVDGDTGQLFEITTPGAYVNAQQVQLRSVDTGDATNIAAGKRLTWVTLRPGCFAFATVTELSGGIGFSGGRSLESLDEWKDRIRANNANPAGHGNEGDAIALAEDISGRVLPTGEQTAGHGQPVAKAFVYPALMGTGTSGLTFVVKQDDWWRSRIPTSPQLSTVFAYVAAQLPKDSWVPVALQNAELSVDVIVSLNPQSAQWADFAPWPSSAPRGQRKVIGSTTSTTVFDIVTEDGDYTAETNPVPGQNIGLYDYTTGRFVRKVIATVTGTGPWAVTTYSNSTASDTAYTPRGGQAVCPWCDPIQDIAAAIGRHVAQCGPGQVVESDPGDGVRQIRVPLATPAYFPTEIGQRIGFDITGAVPAVSGASLLSAQPATLPVAGLDLAYVFSLLDIGVYAQ